ncbi:hypothetical protein BV22DRAFT_74430 [Leucogyrophana mollusca]|uniref:Uncharacterized protein n=1 Tax=Leucogyrophana mollusca TaxID=85980 RepID=A0ACB8BZ34_9AGAM|nr:hypothetical protein BV22DRAFT_74430 [Leucogyrophana mollusca]
MTEGLLKRVFTSRGTPTIVLLLLLAHKPLSAGLDCARIVLSRSQSRIHALLAYISTRLTPLLRSPWFYTSRFTQYPLYNTYATPEDEARYWRAAVRHRRLIDASDARTAVGKPSTLTPIPLVTYYTPRLLPTYRNSSDATSGELDFRISARTFCKWHRMVFRGSLHPTLAQAASALKYYSRQDLREIQRIARLLPDAQVFTPHFRWTYRYKRMWKNWLARKGPDLVIVFE